MNFVHEEERLMFLVTGGGYNFHPSNITSIDYYNETLMHNNRCLP